MSQLHSSDHPTAHAPDQTAPFRVRIDQGYRSLVAAAPIATGTPVIAMPGRVVSEPTRYSVQIEADQHLDPEEAEWKFINHGCEPNLRANLVLRQFEAVRDISEGEEFTFNYLSTEWELSSPFDCTCRAPLCFGRVSGFRFASATQRSQMQGYLTDHLRRRALTMS